MGSVTNKLLSLGGAYNSVEEVSHINSTALEGDEIGEPGIESALRKHNCTDLRR